MHGVFLVGCSEESPTSVASRYGMQESIRQRRLRAMMCDSIFTCLKSGLIQQSYLVDRCGHQAKCNVIRTSALPS